MRAVPVDSTSSPSERRWALRVGRVFGVNVFVHVTFFLVLAWFAAMAWTRGARAAASQVLLVVLLFVCVVLHELGHALMARRFGITTQDITLYPIGGVARLERMPGRPSEELLVALAGPTVNLVLAAILFAFGGLRSWVFPTFDERIWEAPFLGQLLLLNLGLALFNLLPAFPMDGGRVLRALLALRMEHGRATEVAARIGQLGALALGFLGLFYNPLLVLVSVFVWFGAAQEASAARVRGLLHGLPVSAAMATGFRVLAPSSTLGEAADLLLHGSQHDFPVVHEDSIVGVLSQRGLVAGLRSLGSSGRVEEAMERSFLVAHPSDMLEVLFEQLKAAPCPAVPVIQDDRLVGLLTTENISELLMVRAAVGHVRVPAH